MARTEGKALIEQKLEEVRRNLLDLTRRNRLLNHRSTGQRTLQILETSPAEVYRVLVEEQRVMHFLPRDESQPEARSSPTATDDAASDSLPPTASEPHAGTAPPADSA